MSIKHCEVPVQNQLVKVRLVALDNPLFVKYGQVWKDLHGCDAAHACSTTARFVEAPAASHQLSPTAIDLVQAYAQVHSGGDVPYYFSPSNSSLVSRTFRGASST